MRRGARLRALWLVLACSAAAGCGLRSPAPVDIGRGVDLLVEEPVWQPPSHDPFTPLPPPAQTPSATAAPQARSALLVGINHARGARPLTGAVGDVEALQEALVGYGTPREHIVMLTEAAATREAILEGIAHLARAVPETRVVFAFAGHTRKIGGQNHIVTADGRTISASMLAERLSAVRSPAWIALPTCYAAGFRLPGIVGPNRVVTFASPANEMAYETSGWRRSFLFQYMVEEAMLGGLVTSVERAFAHAEEGLRRDHPQRVPLIDDQYPGDFELGPRLTPKRPAPGPAQPAPRPPVAQESDDQAGPAPAAPSPAAEPPPQKKGGLRACSPQVTVGRCRVS